MKKILLSLFMLCCMTAAWAEGTGDGSKDHPFSGEWEASEIGPKLEAGMYLAFDCVIKNGGITVHDLRLKNKMVAANWPNWAPGNLINAPEPGSDYEQYGKDNPLDNRKSQSFLLTYVSPSAKTSTSFTIGGYFTGFYTTPDADGFVYVESAEQMWIILRGNKNVKANERAKIKLTGDIYLTDIAVGTFCSTFYGTLDGDGHTIHGSHDGTRQNKTYLFTYSDGATFRNLNFYNIRVDNRDNSNQAIITSQAKNGCVFENITFDKVSTYTSGDNTGAAAGYATTNCIFKDITVKNSDFTVNETQSGAVVGHAMNCTFTNIKIENCESTARGDVFGGMKCKAGGVVGRSDYCTFNGVGIHGCFIKVERSSAGGIAGYSENSQFTNCIVDDQSCVYANGESSGAVAAAGGIVGYSGKDDKISYCINSALIAARMADAGGIVGYNLTASIVGCLNTGMVIAIEMSEVNDLYTKYKTKTGMTCVTKTYQGKEYVIRKYDGEPLSKDCFGGIIGRLNKGKASKCVNLGSVYSGSSKIGGIAGVAIEGEISDCVSDFSGSNDSHGICRADNYSSDGISNVSIKNCINLTTYKDLTSNSGQWKGVSGGNNYSLTTDANAEMLKFVTKTTVLELASGMICNRLGSNWEQNIATDAYPTPTGNKGVYYTRNITNEYGTLCLPFELESTEDITYYRFNNPDVKYEDGCAVLEFEKMDHVEAGVPVLFRASKTGEFTFRNTGSTFSNTPWDSRGPGVKWFIEGVYNQTEFTESTTRPSDRVYYVSNNEIRNAKKTTIAPYRAWIGGPSINELTAAGVKSIRFAIEDEDGETTALEFIGEDLVPVQNNGKTYSLMGTEVGEGYRGIVIKNGKKMIQRK